MTSRVVPLSAYRPKRYVPPRNAVTELMVSAPAHVRDLMAQELAKIRKKTEDAEWPEVPYHYGMGRIKAYEDWLASLSEEERKREIQACRARYVAHYQGEADLLIKRMRELGHDIEPNTRRRTEEEREPDYGRDIGHVGLEKALSTPIVYDTSEQSRSRRRARGRGYDAGYER